MLDQRPDLDVLDRLRQAGRIAATAREAGLRRVLPGTRLRDVCRLVEDEIERLGGGLAFPVQTSLNHVAAHYCPGLDDESCYAAGDLAKLDIGVHVEGWVVDTAVTVEVGRADGSHPMIAAARDALSAAIAVAGPGVPVSALSTAIARAIRGAGFRPMRNLCGHGVGYYTVHCPPPVPNEPDEGFERLRPGMAFAIEPFATDGAGLVAESGQPEVFRVDPRLGPAAAGVEADGLADIVGAIQELRGLPFARHQLLRFGRGRVDETLALLQSRGALQSFAPLLEATRRPVAQAEHTLYVSEDGVEVLTR